MGFDELFWVWFVEKKIKLPAILKTPSLLFGIHPQNGTWYLTKTSFQQRSKVLGAGNLMLYESPSFRVITYIEHLRHRKSTNWAASFLAINVKHRSFQVIWGPTDWFPLKPGHLRGMLMFKLVLENPLLWESRLETELEDDDVGWFIFFKSKIEI